MTSPTDVDAWRLSVFPEDLWTLGGVLMRVELVGEPPSPLVRDDMRYDTWVHVGCLPCSQYLKVEPRHKHALIHVLQRNLKLPVSMSSHPLALVECPVDVWFPQFVRALLDVGCETVRVQAHGTKSPVSIPSLESLGNPEHPLADTNSFDLGRWHRADDFVLVKVAEVADGVRATQLPMLGPLGKGFGSLRLEPRDTRGGILMVKVHSVLKDWLQAFGGVPPLRVPRTARASRARRATLERRIAQLTSQDHLFQIGSVRVELSVRAPTVRDAVALAEESRLLDFDGYTRAPPGDGAPPAMARLEVLTVSKARLLEQARALLRVAERRGTFDAPPADSAPPREASQVVADLYNCLGWSSGHERLTPWDAAGSWWDVEWTDDGGDDDEGGGERQRRRQRQDEGQVEDADDAVSSKTGTLPARRSPSRERPRTDADGS